MEYEKRKRNSKEGYRRSKRAEESDEAKPKRIFRPKREHEAEKPRREFRRDKNDDKADKSFRPRGRSFGAESSSGKRPYEAGKKSRDHKRGNR
ncbi:MAG: hypothetical protein VB075_06740 [Petrimonas sp.]|uniref:hypothetical protein n=1 Tax=Petrimonas sp. TaxID=2023866 RepID=UPI002B3ABBEF|nr:hypothetical protein [Petrimonas sp.]